MIRNEEWSTMRRLLFMHGAMGAPLKEYEAEGNPAVFQTNVAKPLSGFTIPFLPVQTGSGDPSPQNIRPIIGWQGLMAWRTGVNLFDFTQARKTIDCFGESGSAIQRNGFIIHIPSGTYTFSVGRKVNCYIYGNVINADGTWKSSFQIIINDTAIDKTITISNGEYISVYDAQTDADHFGSVDIQLEPGSTPSPYAEYTGASYSVTFPALGKNLLPPTVYNYAYINDAIVEGTNYRGMYARIPSAGTYRISRESVTGNRFRFYASVEEPSPGVTVRKLAERDSQSWATVDFPEGYNYLFIYLANDGSEITPNIMVSEGSTALPYEPYTNTVYGGTAYPLEGMALVEWKATEIKGTTSLYGGASNYDGTEGTNRMAIITPTGLTEGSRKGFSDIMKVARGGTWAEPNNFIWQFCVNASEQLHMVFDNATVGITSEMTASERTAAIKAWLADNPITFVLPLATPYEIPLDPITIQTLLGDNAIWTDTNGSNTIKYKKKG